MGCFMNILWLMFGGIITAVEYLIASLLMMFTIIGIPIGMQTLKMASLALWPFGKEVRSGERSNGCLYVLMNILWIFLGGIWICLSHLGFGLLLCQRQNHVKGNQLLCLGHTAGNLAKIMKLDFQRQRIPAEIGVLQSPHQLHCRMVQLYNDG